MPAKTNHTSLHRKEAGFAATRWSMVLLAAGDPTATDSRRALAELAGIYWFPLYVFIRRRGHSPQMAEDLTQEFFTRLLEKKSLASVDPAKGKFRSFLLASLQHFLSDEWDKSRTIKRGGGRPAVALDGLDAEARYAMEPADPMTPERLFERRWALALLDTVLNRLSGEYRDRGKGPLFEALMGSLTGSAEDSTHAQAGQTLGMSEAAVKVAAHRLRRRYRELLREEVAQTVAEPGQVGEELGYLLGCL